ncbi:nitrate reductase [Photobacterium jeanii]|uniref:Nitrate reductase n=1 Tax=Photobacterium jeanii TaxID=858640 RepID=A0A178KL57_9GAMM|nr:nucleotidyltransferase family protein [Photobacterium jeanii]OAN17997.1 nitrate reductase [Photobacterium jeanii]PST92333.1 nitrate reductase [Photobacterium jeanii]
MTQEYADKIIEFIERDPVRVAALDCVYRLDLPQCYIAAGFVRNLVWDALHNKVIMTPLNDVDVIYFDSSESDVNAYLMYEQQLQAAMPNLNWQVRNQALMHERNGDSPYSNTLDAMSYWPEKETAVGIRKVENNRYDCIAAFGFESLFNLNVTHNLKRPMALFEQRLYSKAWLSHWPLLTVLHDD